MGNSNCSPSLGCMIKCCLYDFLGVGVESGCSFVEKENFWIPEQRTSNGNTLYS